jgi:mono/diheme cytochrome c family protein
MIRKLLLALVVVVVGMSGIVFIGSEYRLNRKYLVAAAPVAGRSDSASLSRGGHLYRSIGCATCHSADGGGALYLDAGPIGLAVGTNLTRGRGGIGSSRTDGDLVRAIRHGVRQDGSSLILMPSEVYVHLTDEDLGAIIGYLRQLPPVDRKLPATHLRLLGRALLAVGKLNLLAAAKTPPFAHPAAISPGPTAAYGRYLADIASCRSCHGSGLSGGPMAAPGAPPSSNLTPASLSAWSEKDFFTAMREGRRPDGAMLHEIMPWKEFCNMTDEDLAALWQYLRSVPSKPSGGR